MNDFAAGRFGRFESDDLNYTRERMGKVFCPHKLWLVDERATLNVQMTWYRHNNILVSEVGYGADVAVEPDELESFYAVLIPLSGQGDYKWGGTETHAGVGDAVVASPDRPLKMRLAANVRQVVVRIEKEALHETLSGILGIEISGPIRFVPDMRLNVGRPEQWYQILRKHMHYVSRPVDELAQGMLSALELELMTGLLLMQRNNYTNILDADVIPASAEAILEAKSIIDLQPDYGWRIRDYASAVNISVRALEKGFQIHVGMTPSAYLREVRLQRTHDELLEARPGETTVSAVAARLHFHNFGRFSAGYKELFGESPSETFRRE
jgi:AraC-like DNA-binding protein